MAVKNPIKDVCQCPKNAELKQEEKFKTRLIIMKFNFALDSTCEMRY